MTGLFDEDNDHLGWAGATGLASQMGAVRLPASPTTEVDFAHRKATAVEMFSSEMKLDQKSIKDARLNHNETRFLEYISNNPRASRADARDALDVGQSVATHSIKSLYEKGLVSRRREGRTFMYILAEGVTEDYVKSAVAKTPKKKTLNVKRRCRAGVLQKLVIAVLKKNPGCALGVIKKTVNRSDNHLGNVLRSMIEKGMIIREGPRGGYRYSLPKGVA